MSLDNRQAILERMFAIFDTLRTDILLSSDEQLVTVVRNRGVLSQDERPAGAMLDGDERLISSVPAGRRAMTAGIFEMSPQFFIILKTTKVPHRRGDPGTLLNFYRGLLVTKFRSDAELLALLGSNGSITYSGMTTDLKTGMPMEGQAQFDFTVKCVVNPYA